ncbi:MAG: hypothetical protein ACK4N5_27365, partial [Myxococcales bacterium]
EPARPGLPGRVPRVFDVGLGFRPFTERVTLGADFLADDAAGLAGARLSYAANLELIEGLILRLGLSHPTRGDVRGGMAGQVGLAINGGHVGLDMASSAFPSPAGGGTSLGSQLVQLRLSRDAFPALQLGARSGSG